MKIVVCLMAMFFLLSLFITQCQPRNDSDLETIRKRVITELLEPEVNQVKIEKLMNSINEDGSWPDINYKDVSSTGFEHGEHLDRLVSMSRAYKKPGSALRDNKQLEKAIDLALNYWLRNDFIADNWWWNQIGTPRALVEVLLILDEDLTEWQIAKALPIVARANYMYAWGARPSGDRIKIAGIQAKRLLFERDYKALQKVIDVIEEEIKFSTGKGMQYDFSYHHRDDEVNNTLAYGVGFSNVAAYWAAVTSETKYQFGQRSIHLLVNYYLDGICKMMAYGKYPDPGALNREITRKGSLEPYSPVTPKRLLKATDYRKKDLKMIIKIRKGETKPSLSFSRFYWQSDYFTFQRPDFFTSVRMYSSRNHNMEISYNGEGLMNHYRGDGTNYLSRTGREYAYLAPVYDWQKIPGATIMQRPRMPPPDKIQQKGLTDFVGAVTDRKYGAVGFKFKSPIDPLKAKKSWFFFDNAYVCLGAGIAGNSTLPVVTTLNQVRLRGDVLVKNKKQKWVLKKGLHQFDQLKWVWHDKIGYIFPKPATVHLSNRAQTGSWYRVNHQTSSSKKEVSKDVFKLWVSHGSYPEGATYRYIVVPAIGKQGIEEFSGNNSIKVLSNTPEIQAVKNAHLNIFEGVFYKPGSIRISDSLRLIMKDPGIFMIKTNGQSVTSISVADPTHHLEKIHLALSTKIKKKDKKLFIFSSSWDKSDGMSHITIELPQQVYAGKSVTINFTSNK